MKMFDNDGMVSWLVLKCFIIWVAIFPSSSKCTSNCGSQLHNDCTQVTDSALADLGENLQAHKIRIMKNILGHIKSENPIAYEKVVEFFEKHENARRLKRAFFNELISKRKNKQKSNARNRRVDRVECHPQPQSGKELIQIFVKGLKELYPEMTKMLLSELQQSEVATSRAGKCTASHRLTTKIIPCRTTKKMKCTGPGGKRTTRRCTKHTTKHSSCTRSSCTTPFRPLDVTTMNYGGSMNLYLYPQIPQPKVQENAATVDTIDDLRLHRQTQMNPTLFSPQNCSSAITESDETTQPDDQPSPDGNFQPQATTALSKSVRGKNVRYYPIYKNCNNTSNSRYNEGQMFQSQWKEWVPHENIPKPNYISDGVLQEVNQLKTHPNNQIKSSSSRISLNRPIKTYSQNSDVPSPLFARGTPNFLNFGCRSNRNENKKRSMFVYYDK